MAKLKNIYPGEILQLLMAKSSLRNHKNLKPCSWQRLLIQFPTDPDLSWLVGALSEKSGLDDLVEIVQADTLFP